MRIAYVTTYDSSDVSQWSGLGFYIAEALRAAGLAVAELGPVDAGPDLVLLLKKAAYLGLMWQRHLIDREPAVLRRYAGIAAQHLREMAADVVFSPGTIPVSHLHCRQPIVFWTDATFAGMREFYPEFSRLSAETIRNGDRMERAALTNCRLAIYSSDWAARSAIDHYGVDPKKIAVVPFGANLDVDPGLEEAKAFVAARPTSECRLLFLGADWQRKGGPTACEVARLLNERGLPTTLTVVGCWPNLGEPVPDFVRIAGPLSKAVPAQKAELYALLAQSHFLVLPSQADCTPVVFGEANAFAVPCLASDVGGVASIVVDGANGQRFSRIDPAAAYCNYIEALYRRYADYKSLALGSFARYKQRLNWRVAGAAVRSLIERHCA